MQFNSNGDRLKLTKQELKDLEKAEAILKNAGRLLGDEFTEVTGKRVQACRLKLATPTKPAAEVDAEFGRDPAGRVAGDPLK